MKKVTAIFLLPLVCLMLTSCNSPADRTVNKKYKNISVYINKFANNQDLILYEFTDKYSLDDTLINLIISEKKDDKNLNEYLKTVHDNMIHNLAQLDSGSDLESATTIANLIYMYMKLAETYKLSDSDLNEQIYKSIINCLDNMEKIDANSSNWINILDNTSKVGLVINKLKIIDKNSLYSKIKYILSKNYGIDKLSDDEEYMDTFLTYQINNILGIRQDTGAINNKFNDYLNNNSKKPIDYSTLILLNAGCKATGTNNSKVKTIVKRIAENVSKQIDLPVVIKLNLYELLENDPEYKTYLSRWVEELPHNNKFEFSTAAALMPTFRTFYGYLKINEYINNYYDQDMANTYLKKIFKREPDISTNYLELYYCYLLKPYFKGNKDFTEYLRNNMDKFSARNLNISSKNFVNSYYALKLLQCENIDSTRYKDSLNDAYNSIRSEYAYTKDILYIDLIYIDIMSNMDKEKAIELFKNKINEINNYNGDFTLDIAQLAEQLSSKLRVKIDHDMILNKIKAFKISNGYCADRNFKSMNIMATEKGLYVESIANK